ncbi:MAG: DNA gyrase inhibitor YacG [Sphingomonadaceae bacterium]|nr:DNA gyrase inhibitor YacG [Sphingomonadaceae bacterium]
MSMPPRPDSRLGRCPVCGKPETAALKPFCSQLCRDRDLISWLDERYRVPVHPDEELPAED